MAEKFASREIVVFNLGPEKFALFTDQVRSIEEMQEIVPVPQSPGYISGLINLRGEIIAVMDLRRRLKLKDIQNGRDMVIVVVEHGSEAVGLIVDRVLTVEQMLQEPSALPESILQTEAGGFYQSVIDLNGERIILLNLNKILTVEETK